MCPGQGPQVGGCSTQTQSLGHLPKAQGCQPDAPLTLRAGQWLGGLQSAITWNRNQDRTCKAALV